MSGMGIGGNPESGVRALWASVLYQAIMDWIGSSELEDRNAKKRAAEDAQAWFFSDCFEPGSFRWICSVLNIHHSVILEKLNSRPLLRELVAKQSPRWRQKINPTSWETRRENAGGNRG